MNAKTKNLLRMTISDICWCDHGRTPVKIRNSIQQRLEMQGFSPSQVTALLKALEPFIPLLVALLS